MATQSGNTFATLPWALGLVTAAGRCQGARPRGERGGGPAECSSRSSCTVFAFVFGAWISALVKMKLIFQGNQLYQFNLPARQECTSPAGPPGKVSPLQGCGDQRLGGTVLGCWSHRCGRLHPKPPGEPGEGEEGSSCVLRW